MSDACWTFCRSCGSHWRGKSYACELCGSSKVRTVSNDSLNVDNVMAALLTPSPEMERERENG